MPREKENFREQYIVISEAFNGKPLLNVSEVARGYVWTGTLWQNVLNLKTVAYLLFSLHQICCHKKTAAPETSQPGAAKSRKYV